MKTSLRAGIEGQRSFNIDEERTISFMGDDLRVYSTPYMVRDIEETSRLVVQEHLDRGEETVGAHVSVDHLGASLIGMTATVSVKIIEVDGQRVTLEALVHDGHDTVGKAKHVRFVIDRDRQAARLEKKRAQLS
ncbi:MAG: LysR family transcriptional regulator [Pseudomonadota bacterium]|nr:LysR family transcriptional regulator [Pseudomonadota bacterium]